MENFIETQCQHVVAVSNESVAHNFLNTITRHECSHILVSMDKKYPQEKYNQSIWNAIEKSIPKLIVLVGRQHYNKLKSITNSPIFVVDNLLTGSNKKDALTIFNILDQATIDYGSTHAYMPTYIYNENDNTSIIDPKLKLLVESEYQEKYQVEEIMWTDVNKIWRKNLPSMSSQQTSSMVYDHGEKTIAYSKNIGHVVFFAVKEKEKIIGVTSAHEIDNMIRMRGTWVHDKYRGRKIFKVLTGAVIDFALELNRYKIFTFPKLKSIEAYLSMGFYTDYRIYDLNDQNYYAELVL